MEKDQQVLLWTIIGVVVLLLLGSGTMMGGYGMMGYGMGFGFLFMLLFIGSIIWLIVTLVNAAAKKEETTPLTVLKKRYAAGEISKKQYETMKKELE